MRLTLAQILFIGAAIVLALCPIVSVAAPGQADDLYVLCVTGSGPWCDDSTEYTKAACETAPQMLGWPDGTNPFYCKPLAPPEPRGPNGAWPCADCEHDPVTRGR